MVLDMKRVVIQLQYREIVPVHVAGSIRIDCLRGRVWVTEPRSVRDIVLEAGGSYEVARRGVAVVQALREATIALRPPATYPASPAPACLEAVGCVPVRPAFDRGGTFRMTRARATDSHAAESRAARASN